MAVTVMGRSAHSRSIAPATHSTCSGTASVATGTTPIGQSELTMSSSCLARGPCGVLVSMCIPYAASATGGPVWAHPEARTAAVVARAARTSTGRDVLLACPRNVQHNLELQQRGAGGDRLVLLTGVRLHGRTLGPRLERFVGLPLGDHEVAVLALDRTQQLEAEEAGLAVDGVGAVGEPLLQLRACVGGHLDGIDLHDGHVLQATRSR